MSYRVTVTRTPITEGAVTLPEWLEGVPLVVEQGFGPRLFMVVDDGDRASFDELPFGKSDETVRVTNLLTDEEVLVKRGDCGLGCYCAAVVA